MPDLKQIYRCSQCGHIMEVIYAGKGEPDCCGQEMELLVENSVDAALEKHVPVITGDALSVIVKIGSVPHPMLPEHYITFIELITRNDMVLRAELKPGMEPAAVFPVGLDTILYAREYCNLHGLWKNT